MDRIVAYNAIKTPDGTVLISRYRHDYVTHVDSITKETYLTDGGTGGYVRRSVNVIPAEDLSVYTDDDFELVRTVAVRGSRGINSDQPLHWIKICDMTDDHLKAVLEYGAEKWHLDVIKKEIEFRQKNKPSLHQYLISVGRSLNNYSYDPIKVLNNVHYFADCYNKSIKVKDALDNFSKL